MSSTLKLSLDNAKESAAALIEKMTPACQRIRVAGSIRRRAPYVGDIELVAIPYRDAEHDLFGRVVARHSQLDLRLLQMREAEIITEPTKDGPRYKQFNEPRYGLTVDLFITDHDRWPIIYTIRTGSAEFARWLVTSRRHGGALPTGMKIKDGLLWRHKRQIPVVDERDLFETLGVRWLDPPQRTRGYWDQPSAILQHPKLYG